MTTTPTPEAHDCTELTLLPEPGEVAEELPENDADRDESTEINYYGE